jgi:hypothetical protein
MKNTPESPVRKWLLFRTLLVAIIVTAFVIIARFLTGRSRRAVVWRLFDGRFSAGTGFGVSAVFRILFYELSRAFRCQIPRGSSNFLSATFGGSSVRGRIIDVTSLIVLPGSYAVICSGFIDVRGIWVGIVAFAWFVRTVSIRG